MAEMMMTMMMNGDDSVEFFDAVEEENNNNDDDKDDEETSRISNTAASCIVENEMRGNGKTIRFSSNSEIQDGRPEGAGAAATMMKSWLFSESIESTSTKTCDDTSDGDTELGLDMFHSQKFDESALGTFDSENELGDGSLPIKSIQLQKERGLDQSTLASRKQTYRDDESTLSLPLDTTEERLPASDVTSHSTIDSSQRQSDCSLSRTYATKNVRTLNSSPAVLPTVAQPPTKDKAAALRTPEVTLEISHADQSVETRFQSPHDIKNVEIQLTNPHTSTSSIDDVKTRSTMMETTVCDHSVRLNSSDHHHHQTTKSNLKQPKKPRSISSTVRFSSQNTDTDEISTLRPSRGYTSSTTTISSSAHSSTHTSSYLWGPAKNTVPVKTFNKPGGSSSSNFGPLLLNCTLEQVHNGPIWSLSLSPDGRYLASAGEDGTILIWEVGPNVPSKQTFTEDEQPQQHLVKETRESTSTNETTDEEEFDWRGRLSKTMPPTAEMDLGTEITNGDGPPLGTEIKFLSTKPLQRFTDHTRDVVDLSWSHTNFLASASLDKSVRLYHPSRSRSLRVFRHQEMVTTVAFHPKDDGRFLSGSFDCKLRVWSIPDGRVLEWTLAPEVITTARYVPGGRFIVAGLLHGQVYFYSAYGLKYHTQIAAKNRHGKQRSGKKVTGLTFLRSSKAELSASSAASSDSGGDDGSLLGRRILGRRHRKFSTKSSTASSINTTNHSIMTSGSEANTSSTAKTTGRGMGHRMSRAFSFGSRSIAKRGVAFKEQMLVTTNDSRIRLYGLDDYCMIRKYKGLVNTKMQIRARFSETGDFIICGSEVGSVYIWGSGTKTQPTTVGGMNSYDRVKSFETFEACSGDVPIVIDTLFLSGDVVRDCFMKSALFPTLPGLHHVQYDLSSAVIVTADYNGTIRVFLRRVCFDAVNYAAGNTQSFQS